MGLTRKDGFAALLAGLAVLVLLAVTQTWGGWLFYGSYRLGIVCLAIVGLAAHGFALTARRPPDSLMTLSTLLGVVAVAVVIGGLIVSSEILFLVMAADVLTLWAVATLRHLAAPRRTTFA